MKRIKIPSIASIHLDGLCRRFTPAGYRAGLTTQRLRESFSFLTRTSILFYPFMPVSASLPGYSYLLEDICVLKKLKFT